ncbi:hypothetical protein VSP20_04825 [Myroides phaeus]|uniref:hypothetical protein n=1 Tax=Myroides phaeus TaxID=702745 RepID=UPI002DBEF601|nr:hypothetical protein [Myroides phaeus]MEC4116287.1 hypothetical protein [Myroides phaeus]
MSKIIIKSFGPMWKVNLKVIVLSIAIGGCLVACKDSDPVSVKIETLDKSQALSASEVEEIKGLIEADSENRKYKRLFDDDGLIVESKLEAFLTKAGFEVSIEQQKSEISRINFYLESSGSIDGYLEGNTSYKNDIIDLLVDIKNFYSYDKINLSYITNKITPLNITDNTNDIAKALTVQSFRKAGNRANSDLNDILNMSFNIQDDSEVTFVASDMIYSINGANVLSLLNAQKSFIKDAFNKALKKDADLSTLILKMNSEFNGVYYSYNNKKTILKGDVRPYYIFVFGGQAYLNDLIDNLNLLKRKGIKEYYYFTPNNSPVYYTLLKTKNDKGNYKQDRLTDNAFLSLSDVKTSRSEENEFSFTVGVDFSKTYLPSTYLLDSDNYEITKGNYSIDDIEEFDSSIVHPTFSNALGRLNQKLSHTINFEAEGRNFTDLEFSLKKKMPEWVMDVNTEDDLNIYDNMDKTFGFKFLFQGIYESYKLNTSKEEYKEFRIKIRK